MEGIALFIIVAIGVYAFVQAKSERTREHAKKVEMKRKADEHNLKWLEENQKKEEDSDV